MIMLWSFIVTGIIWRLLEFDLSDLRFIGGVILVCENRGVTVWYQSSRLT